MAAVLACVLAFTPTVARAADVLPSWNEGPARQVGGGASQFLAVAAQVPEPRQSLVSGPVGPPETGSDLR
jgi:hypothetical protein